jgi:hypothetical protein
LPNPRQFELTARRLELKLARCIPKSPDYDKINCDAAMSMSGINGAVGAICRDTDGVYLGSSTVDFKGISDLAILESLACRESFALGRGS